MKRAPLLKRLLLYILNKVNMCINCCSQQTPLLIKWMNRISSIRNCDAELVGGTARWLGFIIWVGQFILSTQLLKPNYLPSNPLHPNISIRFLHTVVYTFPIVLKKRICSTINSLFSWSSFPLFSWTQGLNVCFKGNTGRSHISY